jgi:hypothetical protein
VKSGALSPAFNAAKAGRAIMKDERKTGNKRFIMLLLGELTTSFSR